MKVDFYQVEMPNDNHSFDELLRTARATPDDESRSIDVGDITVRLQVLRKTQEFWEGNFLRIRMNELPLKASLGGEVAPLDLEDDEGIGEESAFLFDEETGIIAAQRNRFGVSVGRMLSYISSVHDPGGAVIPSMVIEEDALEKLSRVSTVRKYTVKVAGIVNPRLIASGNETAAEAIQLLSKNAVAPNVEISVAMGHESGGLSASSAIKKLLSLANRGNLEVKKLKVEGKNDDDSPAELNLVEGRMWEPADIKIDDNRYAPYGGTGCRREAVMNAFLRRQSELRSLFVED